MRSPDAHDLLLAGIISLEEALHPGMDLQDLCKLLYQAEMGADHMLDLPRQNIVDSLSLEWSGLPGTGGTAEPALQLISPSATVARLHLAPLRALGVPFLTVAGMVIGQARRRGSPEALRLLFDRAAALSELGLTRFAAEDVRAVPVPEGPPRHSASYGRASYRVINDVTAATELLRDLRIDPGQEGRL